MCIMNYLVHLYTTYVRVWLLRQTRLVDCFIHITRSINSPMAEFTVLICFDVIVRNVIVKFSLLLIVIAQV